jgi:hypothetical protein
MKSKRGRSLLTYLFAGVLLAIPLAASAVDYTVSTVVGGGGSGCTTTPTIGTSITLNGSWAMAADGVGNIYYTDRNNYSVCKILSNGNVVRVAGTGSTGSGADNVAATSSALSDPISIAVDPNGILYIADYGAPRSIRRVGSDGIITTIFNTSHLLTVSGTGGAATAAGSSGPLALAFSPAGELYFSDYSYSMVRKIDLNGNVQAVAGTGTSGNAGDGGAATSATLTQISGIAVDASGNVYLTSYANSIRKIDTSGVITRYAGVYGSSSHTGDGGLATSASFKNLWNIGIDSIGDMYIPERTGSTIRKITAATGIVTTIAGADGLASFLDGSTSVARFNTPYSLALAPNGDIYVGDLGNNRIRKIGGAALMGGLSGPTLSFTALNKYRLTSTINASGGTSGKITFYANGKRIPGCISVTYSGSYSCSWKPTGHGGNTVYASVVTSSNGTLKSLPLTVGIAARTTLR